MNTIDVSVIIVNYNTKELTRNCLRSVFDQTKDVDFEVIVSDNGSSDGSVEMIREEFPQVILLENGENLGFGRANNRGLKIARGKYVFYLNSDTVLLNNAVKLFFDYWENSPEREKIGALGCNLLNEKYEVIHSGNFFPTGTHIILFQIKTYVNFFVKLILENFKINYSNIRANLVCKFYIGEIDYITGADLFLKNDKDAFFDEQFFMYFEETDLQFQMYKKNLKRLLISGPEIIHFSGGSDIVYNRLDQYTKTTALYNEISRIKYLEKNVSHISSIFSKRLTLLFWRIPYNFKKESVKKFYNLLKKI